MPHTASGKYYKIVDGKRQYNARYDKKSAPAKKSYAKKRVKKSTWAPRVGGAIGGAIGTAVSPGLGTIIGSGLGSMAGEIFSDITGYGNYQIKKNIFLTGRMPQVKNPLKGGGTVIRFQEYLSDVYTTADISNPAAFTTQTYLLNAANPSTFPYLSQIASNYEQYAFEGIVFQYRSTSADALNSTNTALGSVMLATQYDVSDAVFSSKSEMLNYEYSNSIKPCDNCLHMVECAPNQNVLSDLYTLRGAVPAGTDSRMFNMGRFCIATVGFQAANVNIGELHVTYQVRLLKPKLYASLGFMNDFAVLIAPTYSDAVPLGGTFVLATQSNFAPSVVSGTLTLPVSAVIKTYRIEVFWTSTVASATALPAPTVANCTLNSNGTTPSTGSTPNLASYISITTTGNSKSASVSYPGSLLPTPASATSCIIRIMQVPQGSTN